MVGMSWPQNREGADDYLNGLSLTTYMIRDWLSGLLHG